MSAAVSQAWVGEHPVPRGEAEAAAGGPGSGVGGPLPVTVSIGGLTIAVTIVSEHTVLIAIHV